MLDSTTKRRIDDCRDILVGKVPDPKSQIDQITVALIYKFMHDMDQEAVELGGTATFFAKHIVKVNGREVEKDYTQYAWPNLMAKELGGEDRVKRYAEALEQMPENPGLPPLFRDIFKNTFLPYRDPATLREFLKRIDEFTYDHSEKLGDAFEYLLSIMGSQGDAGQFRTPRHLIDFMTAVINPQKHETILDPACGTAGFLISAYRHILRHNSSNHAADDPLAFQLHGVKQEDLTVSAKKYSGDKLTPDDRKRLVKNLVGYDIDPGMVKLSLVNLYLHGFPEPHIHEYDTLTSTDRWEERFDVVLANPPFMSPKGGIQPHSKFGIPSTRSEVLFVDYIAEHLNPNGRALVVVPEGIIFQSGKAYKALRKKLVDEHYLVGVVSLPGGVFNPYSGVKTSLLWFDRALARKTDKLLFVKIEHDGFDLGAQRRPIVQNDLPEAFRLMMDYKLALMEGGSWEAPEETGSRVILVDKSVVLGNSDITLGIDRYQINEPSASIYPYVTLGSISVGKPQYGSGARKSSYDGVVRYVRITDIDDDGKLKEDELVSPSDVEEDCMLERGDLLFARSGSVGRCYLHKIDGGKYQYAGYLIRFRIDPTKAIPAYIFWLTQSKAYNDWIGSMKKSGTISNINAQEFSSWSFPLPPLSEQEALVAEVEGYQKVIDGARQVMAHYKPRITIDPKWETVELGEVCNLLNGYAFKSTEYVEEGIRVMRIANVQSGEIVDADPKFMPAESAKELGRFLLAENDILMSLTGNVGRIGRIPKELLPAYVNQRVAKLEVTDKSRLDDRFLYFLLSDPAFEEAAMKNATGVAQGNLSSKWVEAYSIPLPPLPEQERIVAALEDERRMVEAARALAVRMEERVRERVARVWSPSRGASATERHIGSGTGVRPTLVATEAENYGSDEAPELELAVAAEPVPSYGAAQAVVRRGPGRPSKGDGATGNAEAVIQGYLQTHPGWHGKAAILDATGVDAGAWNAAIKALLEAGKVERQGEKKGARYRGIA